MKTLDGKEVPEKVVEEIKYRIRQMPRQKIDEFYQDIGFVVSDAEEDGNRALTDEQLDWIKEGKGEGIIETMIKESDIEEVTDKLEVPEEHTET